MLFQVCLNYQLSNTRYAREHKIYISPPTQKTVSCCNSSTVMYMDLILGVYSKALLQEVVRINASGKAPAWPTLL